MQSAQTRQFYAAAAVLAALLAPEAKADVVAYTYNFGFTDSAAIALGNGDVTIGISQYSYGSINVYNTYTGLNYSTPSDYVTATNISGSGQTTTGVTFGGLQPAGTSVGSGVDFDFGPNQLFNQTTSYYAADGSFAEPYTYRCGISYCTGYNYYSYQDAVYGGTTSSGALAGPVQTGYIGVSIGSGASTNYGWLELETDGSNDGLVDVLASGYETDAGVSIAAGATQDSTVSEPATIGTLAAGLLGLLAMRRKSVPAAA